MQVIDWQTIIAKHGSNVWKTAYRLLGNHDDASDCFQETFVCALEISKRQHVRSFPALLTRLATARAIDQLRRRFRRANYSTEPEEWDSIPSTNPGPDQQVHQYELATRLRQSLSQLSDQEAQVFCMRYLNSMSYRQIAKAINVKTSAAGVLLHRARAKLQDCFDMSVTE